MKNDMNNLPVSMSKPVKPFPMLKYEPAPLSGYPIIDGGMVYNPLSAEAAKIGVLSKYDGLLVQKKIVSAPGFDVEFCLPEIAAPYDVIPIDYNIRKTSKIVFPLTLAATAFEELGRSEGQFFDLSMPGFMDLDIEYLGYVTGVSDPYARNRQKADNSDLPATSYPNYTTTELTNSGSVLAGDLVWLKFKYTNTGNTILDLEGISSFTLEPRLLQCRMDGSYEDIGGLFNEFVRELDYLYPGESSEFWVNFTINAGPMLGKTTENCGLLSGDYKVVFIAYYRTEDEYEPLINMWRGRIMQKSEFKFTVSKEVIMIKPEPIIKLFTNGGGSVNKESWLHYFEEFMTVFEQHRSSLPSGELSGRLWLQVAPWTEQIVLKVVYGETRQLVSVAVPLAIDDSYIGIVYNPNNINIVRGVDGYAWPVVYGQTMADMRANIQISPYPEKTIVRDLLDMKNCGINVINAQGAPWVYDVCSVGGIVSNIKGDALRYAIDLARQLGLQMDSWGTYSYGRPSVETQYRWLTGNSVKLALASVTEADYGDNRVAMLNAPVLLYTRSRWGDIYWRDGNGWSNYTIEDTRGYMRYEMDCRFALGKKAKELFRKWLQEKYLSVDKMNEAWGTTSYNEFSEVDPERGQQRWNMMLGTMYIYHNSDYGFGEWGPGIIDLDEFRTDLRISNYEDLVALLRAEQPSASVQIRTEGSNIAVPGLDPTADNAHFRQIIYNQLRCASIAEKLVATDVIRSYADYPVLPLTPSEVSEVVEKSVEAGLIPMLMPQFNCMRDVAINEVYGRDYSGNYNTPESQNGAFLHTLIAVFPWWKATYEAGGVPGILWQDFQCDGIVTVTQKKEMEYFRKKLSETMNTPEVLAHRKTISLYDSEIAEGKYTYDPQFIKMMLQQATEIY